MLAALRHVDIWIFDLDNSLYPASTNLFELIDIRMGEFIERLVGCDGAEARRIQKGHFRDHGTTLAGLMASHGVDPHVFLDYVHDIDLARITADPAVVAAIDRLPGRKYVFTNGDERYAARVLDRLGLANAFDGMHDIHAMDYVPKPNPAAYDAMCARLGIAPQSALFVEDMARNLKPAKALGMTTVWVDNGSEQAGAGADDGFIDYRTHDIGAWLTDILGDEVLSDALQPTIDAAWEARDTIGAGDDTLRAAVAAALALLDSGAARVAEPDGAGGWRVNQWLKKAVLLSFRLSSMTAISGGPGGAPWWDKVPSKFEGWDARAFEYAGFRAVPGAIVRRGAYVAKGAVLMPSFVNIGAYVGEGTMIDTWATVGSCAQIGANVHISGGTGIGGVLEPLQAGPVIIEDDCFIGARSEVAEGVVVERGAVLSMGVFLGASTKIVDRDSGEIFIGRVPAYSVVVPGSLPPRTAGGPSLSCAVIVKRVDAQTRSKTGINELLRD